MITDKQVKVAANVYIGKPVNYPIASGNIADMRKALEAYEASKWVELDTKDRSTHPPIDQRVMCKPYNGEALQMTLTEDSHPRFDGLFFEDERGFYEELHNITHWRLLPKFKE